MWYNAGSKLANLKKEIIMSKDWSGNSKAVFSTMATNSHSNEVREEHDFYATDPVAIDKLFKVFLPNPKVWECAAGLGHMSKRIKECADELKLEHVYASELITRSNLLDNEIECGLDFLNFKNLECLLDYDIITNPPYKYAEQFIRKGLDIIQCGYYVAMFLPIRYLEGKQRKKLFEEYPPYKVVIMSSRIECAMNGEFNKKGSSAQGYAWFIWQKGTNSKTIIEWV